MRKNTMLMFAMAVCFAAIQVRAEEGAKKESPPAFAKGVVLSVINVTTSKEEAAAFVKAFEDSPKASHKMDGFLGLAVAENAKVPGSFIVISAWKDEASLNAYVQSKGFGGDHMSIGTLKTAKTDPPARFVIKDN